MIVLGSSAACLVVGGEVAAVAAEERFTGGRGTGALPLDAVAPCPERGS